MGFSDKMRDGLGAEGAKIEVVTPTDAVAPGAQAKLSVVVVGGTKAASVDALVVRLIEAQRHWVDADGKTHTELSVPSAEQRVGLTAGWTRSTATEIRIEIGVTVEPNGRHEVDVALLVPASTSASSAACMHTVSVQADIKGQIDPTGQARLLLA